MIECRPSPTPIEQIHDLARVTRAPHDNPEQYRRLVCRLLYLSFTCPHLAYVVHIYYISIYASTPRCSLGCCYAS